MKYFGPLNFKMKTSNEELRKAVAQVKSGLANGEIDEEQYIGFLRQFGEYLEVEPPSVWQNIKYMFQFQFGYMYWRYFMWNFVGKQNDVQGSYNGNGEWLSGIGFIDSLRLGSQENLPKDVLDNKGRNTYFFLPLILGIIGFGFPTHQKSKAILGSFCVFYFYGNCNSILHKSLYFSTTGTGLFACRFLLYFRLVDWFRSLWSI